MFYARMTFDRITRLFDLIERSKGEMSENTIYYFENNNVDPYFNYCREVPSFVAEGEVSSGESTGYSDYVSGITAFVREKAGSEFTVTSGKVLKNNSISLDSITILKNGRNIAPSIYLNDFYPDYLRGASYEEIADSIIEIYHRSMHGLEGGLALDYSFANMKDKIIYRLVNYDMNSEMLRNTPHIRYMDLAVVFGCLIKLDQQGMGTIRITYEHCEKWGIGAEELWEYASVNTPMLLPFSFRNIFNVLADMMLRDMEVRGGDESEIEALREIISCIEKNDASGNSMYVLTTGSGINGAACILYEGLLDKLYDSFGCGFYILPSSVNEVIIVTDKAAGGKEIFRDMVPQVNKEHVDPQDVLSDRVYHYPEDKFDIAF